MYFFNRLGIALLLKYFHYEGRFPTSIGEIPTREKVYTVMRSSYGNHYRRMLPFLLNLLEFRSNNEIHKPVIEALELLEKYMGSRERYYDSDENVPTEDIISTSISELILEPNSDGSVKINRINYELAVLQALRDGLRCK